MHLTFWLFGREVLALSTDSPTQEPDDDDGRDLSGGTLCSDHIEAGRTDRYMGFTGGWESDDDN